MAFLFYQQSQSRESQFTCRIQTQADTTHGYLSGQVAGGGTVIIGDFQHQTTHYCIEYVPCISAVHYNNNVLGEGQGTAVLTNYTINTWSDCHQ